MTPLWACLVASWAGCLWAALAVGIGGFRAPPAASRSRSIVRMIMAMGAGAITALAPVPARAQAIQWHPVDKPVMVEDVSQFVVWIMGHREVLPMPSPLANPTQVLAVNITVAAFIEAQKLPAGKRVLVMEAVAPARTAILLRGLRVKYGTKTILNGQADTPLLATPFRIPPGRRVRLTYDFATGTITPALVP